MKVKCIITGLLLLLVSSFGWTDNAKLNPGELRTLLIDSTVTGKIKWGFFKYDFKEYYSQDNKIEGQDEDGYYTGSFQKKNQGCIEVKYDHENTSANGCYYYQIKGGTY
jgi:hypothetical protein